MNGKLILILYAFFMLSLSGCSGLINDFLESELNGETDGSDGSEEVAEVPRYELKVSPASKRQTSGSIATSVRLQNTSYRVTSGVVGAPAMSVSISAQNTSD